jgi:7-carboxy-7-deazaguanine synthase
VQISEIFYSIQGEGRLIGIPSVFVRTSGCNLRCVWCDTPYTSWTPQGEKRSVGEIVNEVKKYPHRHVVLTGGEPLLAAELEQLAIDLKRLGSHITVETAATIFKPLLCDLVSMSPKLAHSTPRSRDNGKFAKMHETGRLNLAVIQRFVNGYDYQFKFVVQQKEDFAEIEEIIGALKSVDASRVLIMAQGTTTKEIRLKAKWIIDWCKKYGFGYTPRLHIELFGNRRGT